MQAAKGKERIIGLSNKQPRGKMCLWVPGAGPWPSVDDTPPRRDWKEGEHEDGGFVPAMAATVQVSRAGCGVRAGWPPTEPPPSPFSLRTLHRWASDPMLLERWPEQRRDGSGEAAAAHEQAGARRGRLGRDCGSVKSSGPPTVGTTRHFKAAFISDVP